MMYEYNSGGHLTQTVLSNIGAIKSSVRGMGEMGDGVSDGVA